MRGAAPATDDVFCGFVPMTAVPGAAPHAFSYKPEKATATLAVNDRALTLSQEVDSSPPNPAATLSALCPTKYLTQSRFATVADIADIMKGIFVPGQASNDALFNAFHVEEKDECSAVWIFRVTVSQGHGGAPSRSGFATVEEIREKVETARPGKRVEVKYVLVVPFEEKWALRWKLADGFSNVEGELYVQFLRVKAPHADVARELIVG